MHVFPITLKGPKYVWILHFPLSFLYLSLGCSLFLNKHYHFSFLCSFVSGRSQSALHLTYTVYKFSLNMRNLSTSERICSRWKWHSTDFKCSSVTTVMELGLSSTNSFKTLFITDLFVSNLFHNGNPKEWDLKMEMLKQF